MAKTAYNVLSSTECETPGCTKKIKQRLREREKPYKFCYKCWKRIEAARYHFIDSAPRKKRTAVGLPVKNF